jgi:hypothetical protein
MRHDGSSRGRLPKGRALVSAGVFVSLFVVSTVLLGDVLGSFGDPDSVFIEHYGDSGKRAGDIAGSGLLAVLGGVFMWHVEVVRRTFGPARAAGVDAALLASAGFAFALVTGAAALATVPLGREIGNLFDEGHPRLEGPETAALAQFGYVLLFGAGGITAAPCLLFTCLDLRGTKAPGWLVVGGLVAAVALLFSVVGFIPFLALPAWVGASGVAAWMNARRG